MKVQDLIALSADEALIAAAPNSLLLAGPTEARWTATLQDPVAGVELGRWAVATADAVAVTTANPIGHFVEVLARSDGRPRARVAFGAKPLGKPEGEERFVGLWADGADVFASGPDAAGSVLLRLAGSSGEVTWRTVIEGDPPVRWAFIGKRSLVLASRHSSWLIDRADGRILERFSSRGAGCRVGSWYVEYKPDALELRDLDEGQPPRRVPLQRPQGGPDEDSSVSVECRERDGTFVALFGPLAYTLMRVELDGRVRWNLPLPGVTLESHRYIGGTWPERGALGGDARFATLAVTGDAGRSLVLIDLDEGRVARRAGPDHQMPRWTVMQAHGVSVLAQRALKIALVDTASGEVRGGITLDALDVETMPWHLAGTSLWQVVRGANTSDSPWSRRDLGAVGDRDEAERWLFAVPQAPAGDAAP